MGIAKKESARALSREGLAEFGGVWAKGCGVKPIKDPVAIQPQSDKNIFSTIARSSAAVFLIHP